jgi:twitching motility protein PilT
MAFNLTPLLDGAFKHRASDIHISEDTVPYVRIDGTLMPVKGEALSRADVESIIEQIMPEQLQSTLTTSRGADYSYQPNEDLRFRVSTYFERDRLRLVMRLIPLRIFSIEELELPDIIRQISEYARGCVLLTGVTGSGKSTTLAAMLNHINASYPRCIITLEDPIEFVHQNKKSVISQREVGRDIPEFRLGLVQALRQDPDVILVGEMRDPDTIRIALRAAETGHFVFSTLHTTNAVHTVERILAEFPENEHDLLREMLANNLRATITQRLVKRSGGKGRIAAQEIMVANSTIQKLLLDNRIQDIGGVIRGGDDGMQTFDQAIANLVRGELITEAEALHYVEDAAAFKRYVKGVGSSGDRGGIIAGFS